MDMEPFKLERYFAKYEFCTRYLLSSSDCDGYPLQYVLDCADERERALWDNLTLGYTDSPGSLFFREAIAAQYQTISPDEVVAASPGEINFSLMNILLSAGDEAICIAPAYQSLYQVARDLGCVVKPWTLPENLAEFSPESLEELITPKTKLLIINFPHNPTGFIPTRAQFERIAAIADRHGLFIFSDEMYHQLVYNPEDAIPAMCDIYDNSLSLWGMAKTFGMAGVRLGWAAGKRKDLLEKLLGFKDYLTICNNGPGEVLSTIALRHKEKFAGPNIAKITANQRLFDEFARRNSNCITFHMPRAGSTALVGLKTPVSAFQYSEKLLREAGIMLLPSEMFDYGDKHVRIGFGRASMPDVLPVWQAFIDGHPELAGRK